MKNLLLMAKHCKMAELCPLFNVFYGTEIKQALSYNFPECIIHTHRTSILVNMQMTSRPLAFFFVLGGGDQGGIPCG